ncbi:MAG: hypothetical protein ACI4BI_02775 [Anaerotardibacter sp.]
MNKAIYVCKDCKLKYSAETGIVDDFLPTYEQTINAIKEGAYGPEWKSAFDEIIEVAVDHTYEVYVCPQCNRWENTPDLSLYIPRDEASLERIRSAKLTVDRWGAVRPVMRHDLRNCYRLFKERKHLCPTCNINMEKVDIAQQTMFLIAQTAESLILHKRYIKNTNCFKCLRMKCFSSC